MKSARFSPSAGTPRTCTRNKAKKTAPGQLRPGSDPKQKKRAPGTWPTPTWLRHEAKKSEHLAHSLAQLPNKKNCPRYQAKKKRAPGSPQPGLDTKQKKREHLPPGPLQPSSDTLKFISYYLFFFSFHAKKKVQKIIPRKSRNKRGIFFIFFSFIYFKFAKFKL